jgi:hypothetical protein
VIERSRGIRICRENTRLHRGHRAAFVSSLRPGQATRGTRRWLPHPSRPGQRPMKQTVPALPRQGRSPGALRLGQQLAGLPRYRGESERLPGYDGADATGRLIADTYRRIVDSPSSLPGRLGRTRVGGDALPAGARAMSLRSSCLAPGTLDSTRPDGQQSPLTRGPNRARASHGSRQSTASGYPTGRARARCGAVGSSPSRPIGDQPGNGGGRRGTARGAEMATSI